MGTRDNFPSYSTIRYVTWIAHPFNILHCRHAIYLFTRFNQNRPSLLTALNSLPVEAKERTVVSMKHPTSTACPCSRRLVCSVYIGSTTKGSHKYVRWRQTRGMCTTCTCAVLCTTEYVEKATDCACASSLFRL